MFTKNPILTDSGKILFIRALGGEQVTFTRFKAGSGSVPSGTDEDSLTDLVTPELAFGISDVDSSNVGYLKVNGNFSSRDVQDDFRWRELGLFAKGEDNVEVLYCYINDGSNAGMIKKNSSSILSEHDVSLVIAIGDAETFTAVLVSGSLYALRDHSHSAADMTSGVLPAERGGTGKSSLSAAANDMINELTTETSTPVDDDNLILQHAGGGTTTKTYHRKKLSKLWTYIKGKSDAVYSAISHTHAASDINSGTVPLSRGGTGAASMLDALKALGLIKTNSYVELSYKLDNSVEDLPESFNSESTLPRFMDWLFHYLEGKILSSEHDILMIQQSLDTYDYSASQAAANLFTLPSGVTIKSSYANVFKRVGSTLIIDTVLELSPAGTSNSSELLFTLESGFRPYRLIRERDSSLFPFHIQTDGACYVDFGDTGGSEVPISVEFTF